MPQLDAGDVVLVAFRGARETKSRPVVVLSSALYHQHRPDVLLGLLTTQTTAAVTPTDYILQDWQAAGLTQPSAFRVFINTQPRTDVNARIGRLSDRDWTEVKQRVRRALEIQ